MAWGKEKAEGIFHSGGGKKYSSLGEKKFKVLPTLQGVTNTKREERRLNRLRDGGKIGKWQKNEKKTGNVEKPEKGGIGCRRIIAGGVGRNKKEE